MNIEVATAICAGNAKRSIIAGTSKAPPPIPNNPDKPNYKGDEDSKKRWELVVYSISIIICKRTLNYRRIKRGKEVLICLEA